MGSPDDDSSATKGKKRRWRKRLLWSGVLFVVFAWWLNGFGFRLIAGHLLRAQGVEGFDLKGTLWSGVELQHLRWTAEGNETAIDLGEVAVRYDPWRYFQGGVPSIPRELRAHDATITIDLRKPSPKEPSESKGSPRAPLARLPQPEIDVRNLDLNVLLPGDRHLTLTQLDLRLKQGETGHLSWESLAHPMLGTAWKEVKATAHYTETGLRLEGLMLGETLAIRKAVVDITPEQAWALDAEWTIDQGEGTLSGVVGNHLKLTLDSGEINLATMAETWFPDVPIQGRVDQLGLSVADMDASQWHQWTIQGKWALQEAGYKDVKLLVLQSDIALQQQDLEADLHARLDAQNALHLTAKSPLDGETVAFETLPWTATLDLQAPALQSWLENVELPVAIASLLGDVRMEGRGQELAHLLGNVDIGPIRKDTWQVPVIHLVATSGEAHAITWSTDAGELNGKVSLDRAFESYDGKVVLNLPALSAWQPGVEEENEWSGGARLEWSGKGPLKGSAHQGAFTLRANNIGPAVSSLLYQADVEGDYQDNQLHLRKTTVQTEAIAASLEGRLSSSGLEIPTLQVRQEANVWMNGRLSLPLAAEGASLTDRFWKATEPVLVELQSTAIPLASLSSVAGKETPLTGTVMVSASVREPPSALRGEIRVVGDAIGTEGDQPFPTKGNLDIGLRMGDGQATLNGTVTHPHLETVRLDAQVPFQLQAAADLPAAPLKGHLHLPQTDLAFLNSYVDALNELTGTASADVRLSGTVAQPEVVGDVSLRLPKIRFKDRGLPRLDDTIIRLEGAQNGVVIREASATLEGGQIALSGQVDLMDSGPALDLRAQAAQALLARDENLIVRANADVQVKGPVDGATVSGRIGLVESRYFREIELLPTNKPAASLPSSPMNVRKRYGTEAAPITNWKVDLDILTEEPIRVRTNLAAADIRVALALRGTGASVYPDGEISLTDAYAQLPFSRLDLKDSAIRFTQASGFPGILDVRGISQIRDYQTRLAVKGDLNDFHYVLTSTPPLPEEEILSLLGTGTTREDLVGSGQAAASRAALLLFDKLWRKISKKDWEDPESMRQRRLTFESGQVNARTGSTVTTARLRLTDHWSLTGDADLGGDYRGLLHWVINF